MRHERNGKPMRYTDEQIRNDLIAFVEETEQTEIRYIIPYCLGRFGYITNQIWRVIVGLIDSGVIDYE